MNCIERPKQRVVINKLLKEDCNLEDLMSEGTSKNRRTQIKKMIWERDHHEGKVYVKK